MNIVAARINHETNTFSPVATPLASFGPDGPTFDAQALAQARGTRTGLGAFIAAAEARGERLTVAVNATASPSGRVDDAAFERMAGSLVEAARAGCDLLLLDLHGAMVTQSFDDAEGELLRRLRAVAPQTPIAVALDLHGNITQTMIDCADVIVGFQTYPHIDMFETGAKVAQLAFQLLDSGRAPALAWVPLPLLSHTLRSATGEGAMQRAEQRARQLEGAGLLAASVFAGFSLADIRDAGVSVVVCGRNPAEAQAGADTLARQLWAERADFVYTSAPLADSVAQARSLQAVASEQRGPVLLLDHGDNVMSGGSCDTTTVLEECLRQGLQRIGAGPLADPQTVAQAIAAGVGERLQVQLGNKMALGLGEAQRPPLALEVRVRTISDGRFRITGPIYTGETWAMGRTVVLDHAAGTLVVSERPMEPLDLGVFTSVGVNPADFNFLILKSRMYCRPSFGPIARALVECDSRGVTSSDYGLFKFTRLRRPVYPLDANTAFHPA